MGTNIGETFDDAFIFRVGLRWPNFVGRVINKRARFGHFEVLEGEKRLIPV